MAFPAVGEFGLSIHQINKIFQHKGCNIIMSLVLLASVATFIGGGGLRGCAPKGGQDDQSNVEPTVPIVKVGGVQITKAMIDNSVDQQMQQYNQMFQAQGMTVPPEARYRFAAGVLNGQLDSGLDLLYANQQEIRFDSNAVKQRLIAQELDVAKADLENQGKIGPKATEQEIENAFKAANGISLIDFRKQTEQKIDDVSKTSGGEARIDSAVALLFLEDKLKTKFQPTEADIESQYRTYQFQEIDFNPDKTGKTTAKVKADLALKAIKGGLSFEAAMDKYSPPPAPKGKKSSLLPPKELMQGTLENEPDLKPLLKLKPGEMSDVVSTPPSAAIYKLIGSKIKLPKDFQSQKAFLMDSKARANVDKFVRDGEKKLDTPQNVSWSNEGYHLLHDFSGLTSLPQGADRSQKTRDIIKRALALQKDPLAADIAAAAAELALPDATANMAPGDAAKVKVDVYEACVKQFSGIDTRLKLAEAYIDTRDGPNAVATLKDAADMNSINEDQNGQMSWDQLNADIKSAKDKNLITPADAKALGDSYAKWLKEFIAEKQREEQVQEDLSKHDVKPAPQPPSPPAQKKPAKSDADQKATTHPSGEKTGANSAPQAPGKAAAGKG